MKKSTLKYFIVLQLLMLNISSCVIESDLSCDVINPPSKITFSISVLNVDNQDITSSGVAGHVNLYVFDKDQKYIDRIAIPSVDIQSKKPITLEYKGQSDYWVVAWSNLGDRESVTALTKGMHIDEALVSLRKDAKGYAINPSDLFWGIRYISASRNKMQVFDSDSEDSIILPIKRMTARMTITAVGLDTQTSDYRFVISGSRQDSYSFDGQLTGFPIAYEEEGVFDSNFHFVSVLPFSMFPVAEGDYNTISIYDGANLVASVHTNSADGTHIRPIVGGTTNVLIDLTSASTSLDVLVKITDWNDVYQWVEW